ncbi:MAG: ribose-phosphate diphosphokinase [Planctomycetota bacterium]|nr:ribose-phosphate diphosphokinase [Planctomycetota bacterium]
MMDDAILLSFPEYAHAGHRLAEAAGMASAEVRVHRFPDGESLVTLPERLPSRVYVCRSLDHPNEKLVELLLAVDEARRLGAKRVGLVAPYLCYMRQDTAFHPGEAVSQRIIGRLLAAYFDEVLTVAPHLHRVRQIAQAVPAKRSVALQPTTPMALYVEGLSADAILVGPDEESEQWVGAVAAAARREHGVARKIRRGDREVEIELPAVLLEDRPVVLIDDIASSGRTLSACARACVERGASSVAAVVTHALFVGDALEVMTAAGIASVASTDSVPHPTNRIPLAALLAEGLRSA